MEIWLHDKTEADSDCEGDEPYHTAWPAEDQTALYMGCDRKCADGLEETAECVPWHMHCSCYGKTGWDMGGSGSCLLAGVGE